MIVLCLCREASGADIACADPRGTGLDALDDLDRADGEDAEGIALRGAVAMRCPVLTGAMGLPGTVVGLGAKTGLFDAESQRVEGKGVLSGRLRYGLRALGAMSGADTARGGIQSRSAMLVSIGKDG